MNKFFEFLDKKLPLSKYSDGKETNCLIHRLCSVFDPMD